MADQVAVVEFTTPASAGTIDITSVSITESFSAAIFIVSGSTSDSTDNAHGILGIGFCTSNPQANQTNAAIGVQIEDNVTASDNGTRNSTTHCISIPTTADVANAAIEAVYSASIPGGVTLNFTTASVQSKGIAILFAGLTASDIDLVSSGTGTTSQVCAAPGSGSFEPDILVWLTNDHPGGSVNEAEAQPSLGFAINDGVPPSQVCGFLNFDETNPTDSDGSLRSDSSFGWLNLTTRVVENGGVEEFTATGFDHSSNLAGGIRASYLALKFSGVFSAAAANLPISASTGDQDFNLGITPNLVLGMSTLLAAEDTLTDGATASTFGYFVTGDYDSRAYTARNEEGRSINPAGTDASTRQEDVALLTYTHLGAIAQRATWVGGISGGFRLNFSTATTGHMTALGLALDLAPLVQSETIQISDGAVLLLQQSLVTSEAVQISDAFEAEAVLLATPPQETLGASAQAGAQIGRTAQAGPELGETG